MNGIGTVAQPALPGIAGSATGWTAVSRLQGGMEMKVTCDFPEFSEWEVGIVRKIAGQMVRNGGFSSNDREDLEQELLIHLWKTRDGYKPGHASQCGYKTYIRKILNKKQTDLVRERAFQLHLAGCEAVLSGIPADQKPSGISKTPKPGTAVSFLSHKEFNVEQNVVLREEIKRVLGGLTERKQQICILLSKGHRPADIAEELNISRDTVYIHIRQLRAIFENEGLKANFN